jgi:uncharacterized protein (TIGR02996 family)
MSDPMIEGFEAGLRDRPDDLAGWSAYADYLSERGDPRRELMAVQIALEDEKLPRQQRAARKRREKRLLGDLRPWLGEPLATALLTRSHDWGQATLAFRRGWLWEVHDLRCDEDSPEGVLEAFENPNARWVQSLRIRNVRDRFEISPLTRASFLPVLRRFHLGGEEENSYVDRCSGIMEVLSKAPRLEAITLCMNEPPDSALFSARLPACRELCVACNSSFATEKLAENTSLRDLRKLRLVPRALGEGDVPDDPILTLADLERIASSPNLRNLTELRFSLTTAGDEGVDVLIRSQMLFRLEVLDLSHGSITDAGAESLARALAAQPHRLRTLNLTGNALTRRGIAALKKTGVGLTAQHQHAEDDYVYLYEGGNME